MSKLLSASATWDTVRTLATVTADFADREEALTHDQAAQLEKIRRRRDALALQQREQLTACLAELDATLETEQKIAIGKAAARQDRIHRARKAAAQQRQWQVEDFEGRRKYEIQKGTLSATRNRDAELAAAEETYQTFSASLGESQAVLASLELASVATLQGYRHLSRWLQQPPVKPSEDLGAHEDVLLGKLNDRIHTASAALRGIRRTVLPVFFANFPFWVWLILIAVAYGVLAMADLSRFEVTPPPPDMQAVGAGALTAIVLGLYALGAKFASGQARVLASALASARMLSTACTEKSAATLSATRYRIEETFSSASSGFNTSWSTNINQSAEIRDQLLRRVESRYSRALARHDEMASARLVELTKRRDGKAEQARAGIAASIAESNAHLDREEESIKTAQAEEWGTLAAAWRAGVTPLHEALTAHTAESERLFPAWSAGWASEWTAPAEFAQASRVATLEIDLPVMAGRAPTDGRLALPCAPKFAVPLVLTIPEMGSLLIETNGTGREAAVAALNSTILRLLASAPAGRLSFTIIDAVELGQNFAGLMHLADYEERLINSRIWTQSTQIEEQLARLNEHIEKVSQMYLRNEYATIADYNAQAGRIAEKYHFLVVSDLPVNFSDTAARRLMSIAVSGARCGVYTLIHWDHRRQGPAELVPDELRKSSLRVQNVAGAFLFGDRLPQGTRLVLDAPPEDAVATALLHRVGRASVDSNRVEVPFSDVAPSEAKRWSVETTEELRVPIGRTGATKLQYFSLGKGTRQHALIAGKTGSGKSTLFHVMITNLALWCRPDQVEFYLVDFKKGVEFKCYATHRLPHARVVAIESDREFALSVLERLDAELKRRGDLFREVGAQDLGGYRRSGGKERVPRCLLLIDEFQEFFVQDDRIAQSAALLLDRIVRQGRAFGIHVVLGSQTLGGAYTLARATLGQMVVRVALQCNEADSYLIMDENNPAPRLLSRPGEAIYNDAAGSIEGNSPFQIVWVADTERDAALAAARKLADAGDDASRVPIVFEGNAPSDIRDNAALAEQVASPGPVRGGPVRVWLGAPNSIKGPTEAVFARQSGSNLVIVGQREETALAMVGLSLVSLAAQHARGGARFVVVEATAPESSERKFLDAVLAVVPQAVTSVKAGQLEPVLGELSTELGRRTSGTHGEGEPPIFVFIHDLQKFKRLRYEEDFGFSGGSEEKTVNPGQVLNELICEGPSCGIHVICTCDTYNNLSRALSRKAVSEFEMRVLFQMSANDSASLIDSPKASDLGLHRALLYNGQQGFLETFRPYALPGETWLAEAGASLSALRAE